jgi:hypothetical protein
MSYLDDKMLRHEYFFQKLWARKLPGVIKRRLYAAYAIVTLAYLPT